MVGNERPEAEKEAAEAIADITNDKVKFGYSLMHNNGGK